MKVKGESCEARRGRSSLEMSVGFFISAQDVIVDVVRWHGKRVFIY